MEMENRTMPEEIDPYHAEIARRCLQEGGTFSAHIDEKGNMVYSDGKTVTAEEVHRNGGKGPFEVTVTVQKKPSKAVIVAWGIAALMAMFAIVGVFVYFQLPFGGIAGSIPLIF